MDNPSAPDQNQVLRYLVKKGRAMIFIGQVIFCFIWLLAFWLASSYAGAIECKGPVGLFVWLGKYSYLVMACWNIIGILTGIYLEKRARASQQNPNDPAAQNQQRNAQLPSWFLQTWRIYNFGLILLWIYSINANMGRSFCRNELFMLITFLYAFYPFIFLCLLTIVCIGYLNLTGEGQNIMRTRIRRVGPRAYQVVQMNQPVPPA